MCMGKGLQCTWAAVVLPLWEPVCPLGTCVSFGNSCVLWEPMCPAGLCAVVPCKCWPGWVGATVPSCSHGVAPWNLLLALCSLLRTIKLLPAPVASSVSSWFKPRSLFASFSGSPAQQRRRGSPLAQCVWSQTSTAPWDAQGVIWVQVGRIETSNLLFSHTHTPTHVHKDEALIPCLWLPCFLLNHTTHKVSRL